MLFFNFLVYFFQHLSNLLNFKPVEMKVTLQIPFRLIKITVVNNSINHRKFFVF